MQPVMFRQRYAIVPFVLSLLLIVLSLLLITGCGAVAPSPTTVHATWVTALETSDVDQARSVTDPQWTDLADRAVTDLATIREEETTLTLQPTGAFQSVTVEPPVVRGAQQYGISIWTFAEVALCYRTTLIEQDAHWWVHAFHEIPCEGA